MNWELVTDTTARATLVGALKARTVHLLMCVADETVWSLCNKQVRGNVFERPDATEVCQGCIDERDWQDAMRDQHNGTFDHRFSVARVQLGTGMIAGSGMRYGHRVDCYGCLVTDDRGTRPTVIWSSNEPRQGDKAREAARQHFLAKWREYKAAPVDEADRFAATAEYRHVAAAGRKNGAASIATPDIP